MPTEPKTTEQAYRSPAQQEQDRSPSTIAALAKLSQQLSDDPQPEYKDLKKGRPQLAEPTLAEALIAAPRAAINFVTQGLRRLTGEPKPSGPPNLSAAIAWREFSAVKAFLAKGQVPSTEDVFKAGSFKATRFDGFSKCVFSPALLAAVGGAHPDHTSLLPGLQQQFRDQYSQLNDWREAVGKRVAVIGAAEMAQFLGLGRDFIAQASVVPREMAENVKTAKRAVVGTAMSVPNALRAGGDVGAAMLKNVDTIQEALAKTGLAVPAALLQPVVGRPKAPAQPAMPPLMQQAGPASTQQKSAGVSR